MDSKQIIFSSYKHELGFFDGLIEKNKFSCCVLLSGPPMIGKSLIAERLAGKILQTENPQFHPDFIWQSPGDEDSLRKSVLQLIKRVRQRPVKSPFLVIFLDRVDEFSKDAAPALLKALEDAPSYVRFILTATRVQNVLPTIRSRSLVRQLVPQTIPALKKILQEAGVLTKDAEEAALWAGGRAVLALRILTDKEERERYKLWHDILNKLTKLTIAERSAFADEVDKSGKVADVISLLEAILRNRLTGPNTDSTTLRQSQNLLRRSREAIAMLNSNVPARLALEYILFLG